tara:strand:+ start:3262 stop:3492 length:231 start_codon:yes stop_codon:yes gene_type:complete
MKIVKNISLQGLQIPFNTGNEVKYIFLTPKKHVTVPNSWHSQVAENLVHRRMVKLTVTPDPAPVVNSTKGTKRGNK